MLHMTCHRIARVLLLTGAATLAAPVMAASKAAPPAAGSEQTASPPIQVTAQVTLAGVMHPQQLSDAFSRGALVVDLRTPLEIEQAVSETISATRDTPDGPPPGLDYINLPMDERGVTPALMTAFQQIRIAAGERPIIVHCASGNRAGVLWAAHLMESGVTRDAALATVRPIVTKEPAVQAILDYTPGRSAQR